MLKNKNCTVALRNKSGKTGSDLAKLFKDEAEQAKLTPFNHGHKLHLGCESLEAYLELRETMLDKDVAAGIKLWHSINQGAD